MFTAGGYDARYEPIAIDGSLAVTHGRTLYFDPATGERRGEFDNVMCVETIYSPLATQIRARLPNRDFLAPRGAANAINRLVSID